MFSKILNSYSTVFSAKGKEVNLIINFLKEYGEKQFKEDLDIFNKINLRLIKAPEDTRYELLYVPQITKNLISSRNLPDFNYFQKITINLLQSMVKKVLNDMPEILEVSISDFFEIQISIVNGRKRDYYAYHNDEVSDMGHFFIELSGTVVLGRMVVQYFYTQRFDYSFVEKLLLHEFRHQVELMRNVYRREYGVQDKLKKIMSIKKDTFFNKGIVLLYTAFCDTYTEGVANFSAMRNTSRIEIEMGWIRNYRMVLMNLAKMQKKREAEKYFGDIIEVERGSSTYYCGKIMCYIIGLSIAKRTPFFNTLKIYVGNNKFPLNDLNKLMNSSKVIYADNLPPQILNETMKALTSVPNYRLFIQKYEEACNILGISENNRIITWKTFNEIKKTGLNYYKKHKQKYGKKEIVIS